MPNRKTTSTSHIGAALREAAGQGDLSKFNYSKDLLTEVVKLKDKKE